MAATIACFLLLLLAQQPSPGFKAPAPRFADADRRAKLARAFPEIDRLFENSAADAHVPGAA